MKSEPGESPPLSRALIGCLLGTAVGDAVGLALVAFHRKRQDLAEKRATLNSTGCFGGQLATIFDEIARVARADRVKIGKLVQTWPDEYGAAMASIKITAARFARETNTSA